MIPHVGVLSQELFKRRRGMARPGAPAVSCIPLKAQSASLSNCLTRIIHDRDETASFTAFLET